MIIYTFMYAVISFLDGVAFGLSHAPCKVLTSYNGASQGAENTVVQYPRTAGNVRTLDTHICIINW